MTGDMSVPNGHRRRIKHYHDPGDLRELTFSCYCRLPLLTNDSWRCLLAEAVNRALDRWNYGLAAFVFTPEHVHLYWQKGPGYDRNLQTPDAVMASIDYIHNNPVTRKLCRRAIDWRWSSAGWYVSDRREVDDVPPRIDGLPWEFY